MAQWLHVRDSFLKKKHKCKYLLWGYKHESTDHSKPFALCVSIHLLTHTSIHSWPGHRCKEPPPHQNPSGPIWVSLSFTKTFPHADGRRRHQPFHKQTMLSTSWTVKHHNVNSRPFCPPKDGNVFGAEPEAHSWMLLNVSSKTFWGCYRCYRCYIHVFFHFVHINTQRSNFRNQAVHSSISMRIKEG